MFHRYVQCLTRPARHAISYRAHGIVCNGIRCTSERLGDSKALEVMLRRVPRELLIEDVDELRDMSSDERRTACLSPSRALGAQDSPDMDLEDSGICTPSLDTIWSPNDFRALSVASREFRNTALIVKLSSAIAREKFLHLGRRK